MSVFDSVQRMLDAAQRRGLPLWELVLEASAQESGMSREESLRTCASGSPSCGRPTRAMTPPSARPAD